MLSRTDDQVGPVGLVGESAYGDDEDNSYVDVGRSRIDHSCILENSATRFESFRRAESAARGGRIPSSAPVSRPRDTVHARERRVGRYYDPSTDQFISVDPDVAETGQPYAFTGDDPLNGTDPLGLYVSGGGGTSDECNTSASGTIYCTGGNGNGVSAAGSYNPSTGARTGAFVPSTEASDEVANEAAMAAQATTENEATAMTAETGGGSLKDLRVIPRGPNS
jgi:hypothetical protein